MSDPRTTEVRKAAFVRAMSWCGNITAACDKIGISRRTYYDWLDDDADFRAAVNDAKVEAADRLEEALRKRGQDGWLEPVFHQGKRVGCVRKFSDTAAIFLLNGLRPEKYRHHIQHQVSGPNGGAITIQSDAKAMASAALSDPRLFAQARALSQALADAGPRPDADEPDNHEPNSGA